MAVEMKVTTTRINDYFVDPRDMRLNPEWNGRTVLPPIDDLVAGFQDLGQTQACHFWNNDGFPELITGHRRWRTAIRLTEEGLGAFDGVWKLRVSNFKGTPLERFLLTLSENQDRLATTPICDANNIIRLHRFGMTDEDIARRVYRKFIVLPPAPGEKDPIRKPDVRWVRETAALADLCPEAIEAVNAGYLMPSAAKVLSEMTVDAQKAKMASGVKLTAASLRRELKAPPVPNTVYGLEYQSAPVPGRNILGIRRWDKKAFDEMVQGYIEMDLAADILAMTPENAVRTVLGQIQDELRGGLK